MHPLAFSREMLAFCIQNPVYCSEKIHIDPNPPPFLCPGGPSFFRAHPPESRCRPPFFPGFRPDLRGYADSLSRVSRRASPSAGPGHSRCRFRPAGTGTQPTVSALRLFLCIVMHLCTQAAFRRCAPFLLRWVFPAGAGRICRRAAEKQQKPAIPKGWQVLMDYSVQRKFIKSGTSFSQSASQWPPPTWQYIFAVTPLLRTYSATFLFQP